MPVASEHELQLAVGDDVRPARYGLRLVAPEPEVPLVTPVAESGYDMFTSARFRRWLGGLAVSNEAAIGEVRESDFGQTDLLEQIRLARNGDPEALRSVETNVMTALVEACFKDRHITYATTSLNDNGEITQFGQSMSSVYGNAITKRTGRHPVLQAITEAEALNGHRIEDAARAGLLHDNYFVVWSLVPDGVPEKELGPEGDGYFLDNLTFVVQMTAQQDTSTLVTESAFMSGTSPKEEDTVEAKMSRRFDFAAVARIYESFGLHAPQTAAELLAGGLFIDKSLLPNGAADIMRWCEMSADEVLGREVERRPEEYQTVVEESRRREASLESTRQAVMKDLLSDAGSLPDAMSAVRRIWQLVKLHTVTAAVDNLYIDPRVFGGEAEPWLLQARAAGDARLRDLFMARAHQTAVVTGCGGGAKKSKGLSSEEQSDESDSSDELSDGPSESESKEEANQACDYTHDGCYCSAYHSNGKKRATKMRVLAVVDRKGVARCKRAGCNAQLLANGRKMVGTIMKRAMGLDKQAV